MSNGAENAKIVDDLREQLRRSRQKYLQSFAADTSAPNSKHMRAILIDSLISGVVSYVELLARNPNFLEAITDTTDASTGLRSYKDAIANAIDGLFQTVASAPVRGAPSKITSPKRRAAGRGR